MCLWRGAAWSCCPGHQWALYSVSWELSFLLIISACSRAASHLPVASSPIFLPPVSSLPFLSWPPLFSRVIFFFLKTKSLRSFPELKSIQWSPLILRAHVLRSQWMPELLDSTESYIYYAFSYTDMFMINFDGQIRHSKRLITKNNYDSIL